MTIHSQNVDMYLDYLDYLDTGEDKYDLPTHKHDPSKSVGFVHASALGRCPLANFFSRTKAKKTNPKSRYERMSMLHLMNQGKIDAEPIQEAALWRYGPCHWWVRDTTELMRVIEVGKHVDLGDFAATEISVQSADLGIRGRMDVLLHTRGEWHIMEIKRRDAPRNKDVPQPKLSDVYQVLAYGIITGITSLNILTVNRYFINTWTLRPVGGGWMLFNQDGDAWEDELNDPDYINEGSLRAEISLQHAYMYGGKRDIPFPDFLNDHRGWQCGKWVDGNRPKRYKNVYKGAVERTEYWRPSCEWYCHGEPHAQLEVREMEYNSGVYALVEREPC